MRYIKIYEDFNRRLILDIEDAILDIIDDGKCLVSGNNNVTKFRFTSRDSFQAAINRLIDKDVKNWYIKPFVSNILFYFNPNVVEYLVNSFSSFKKVDILIDDVNYTFWINNRNEVVAVYYIDDDCISMLGSKFRINYNDFYLPFLQKFELESQDAYEIMLTYLNKDMKLLVHDVKLFDGDEYQNWYERFGN